MYNCLKPDEAIKAVQAHDSTLFVVSILGMIIFPIMTVLYIHRNDKAAKTARERIDELEAKNWKMRDVLYNAVTFGKVDAHVADEMVSILNPKK